MNLIYSTKEEVGTALSSLIPIQDDKQFFNFCLGYVCCVHNHCVVGSEADRITAQLIEHYKAQLMKPVLEPVVRYQKVLENILRGNDETNRSEEN